MNTKIITNLRDFALMFWRLLWNILVERAGAALQEWEFASNQFVPRMMHITYKCE